MTIGEEYIYNGRGEGEFNFASGSDGGIRHERECPGCGKVIKYRTRESMLKAVRKKSKCRGCYDLLYKKYNTEEERLKGQNKRSARYNKNSKKKRDNGDVHAWARLKRRHIMGRVRHKIKNGGRRIEFEMTAKDLEELYKEQGGLCYYTGMPLELGIDWGDHIASVDRIDSNLGYVRGNIVLCCNAANSAKGVLSEEKFYELVKKLYWTMRRKMKKSMGTAGGNQLELPLTSSL